MDKKLFFGIFAAAGMLFAASCSDDKLETAQPGGETQVAFSLGLEGGMGTRAISDGTGADKLVYSVFDAEGKRVAGIAQVSKEGVAFPTTEILTLAKGQTYKVAFWAQDNDCKAYTVSDDMKVTVDYGGGTNNDEARDAFFKTVEFTVTGSAAINVEMKRPFAQINMGVTTEDWDAAVASGIEIGRSSATVKQAASEMDLVTGETSKPVDVTYGLAGIPAESLSADADGDGTKEEYHWLSMGYFLVNDGSEDGAQKATVESLEFTLKPLAGNDIVVNEGLNSVPVQRNWRTNILGKLLTGDIKFNITIDPIYEGEHNSVVEVKDATGLLEALASPAVSEITVTEDIDLSTAAVEALAFNEHKTIDIAENKTITLGEEKYLTAKNGISLIGGGTITNSPSVTGYAATQTTPPGYQKSLIHIEGGECVIDGVELINDPNFHWHGPTYNSSAISYWNDAKIIIKNARIVSGEFTICGMGRGGVNTSEVTITDSYFESTSTNRNNGKHWAYAMRLFGKKVRVENCEVKGIQGALSIEECANAVISGGKYYTVNTPGQKDAFYPLYITGGATVTIESGEFSAANDRSEGLANGTSAVVSGDNDVNLPVGSVVLKGGKFSGKAYNHVTKTTYEPAEGYVYQAIEGDETYKWEVVAE